MLGNGHLKNYYLKKMNDLAKDENNRELLMAMNDKCNRLADKEIGLENHVLHLPGPDWFWTA